MEVQTIPARRTPESGFGFIETMIAALIIFVGLTAVLGLFAVSMVQEHEQGSVNSRATTYCQTKMEDLQALAFSDGTTNTAVLVWPPTTNGTGLGPASMAAGSFAGSVDPAVVVNGYVDYLDFQGTPVLSTSPSVFFTRQWRIDMINDPAVNLKTITVRTTAKRRLGPGAAPFVTLVSQKSRVI